MSIALCPAVKADTDLTIGWHIPWAVGGPRVDASGQKFQHPGEWPDFSVDAVRLWDTRTAWLNLEPRPGLFDFAQLDRHVDAAIAAGVGDITLVLAGTPRWAAVRESPNDAPWLGPGSAAPPRDAQEWREFVAAVAERFRGRIDNYEIGNEPNLAMFWNGNYVELGALVTDAATIIHQRDPAARVVAPAPLITQLRDVVDAEALWDSLRGSGVDVLAFHYYPRDPGSIVHLPEIADRLRASAVDRGFGDLPLWITESNPGARASAAHVSSLQRIARQQGFDRLYWYAWMSSADTQLFSWVH